MRLTTKHQHHDVYITANITPSSNNLVNEFIQHCYFRNTGASAYNTLALALAFTFFTAMLMLRSHCTGDFQQVVPHQKGAFSHIRLKCPGSHLIFPNDIFTSRHFLLISHLTICLNLFAWVFFYFSLRHFYSPGQCRQRVTHHNFVQTIKKWQ